MSYPDLTDLARQGDPQAIALIIKHHLRDRPVTVKVASQPDLLHILLETNSTLDRTAMANLVRGVLTGLRIDVAVVKLYQRRPGEPSVIWQEQISLAAPTAPATTEHFIVCGLGNLGQYCFVNLRKFSSADFRIHVVGIDRALPETWEVEELENTDPTDFVVGDCRREEVLEQAGIRHCRAIVIATSSEEVNIETAIAARRLNPDVRLVIRSSRQNLNNLLAEQLGNFAAFEPTELSAGTFAFAALGESTAGFFTVGNYRFRVVNETVKSDDYRFLNIPGIKLHKRSYRLISLPKATTTTITDESYSFFQWPADKRIQLGDRIAYVEVTETLVSEQRSPYPQQFAWVEAILNYVTQNSWQGQVNQIWQWFQANRTRQVIAVGIITGFFLWMIGTLLLRTYVQGISWQEAMSSAIILLLGGYGDVFGGLGNAVDIPWWVQMACLLITIVSLLFVLGVLSLIADSILSSRFEFLQRRPAIPKRDHIVLLGFRRVGRRVAAMMQAIRQPIVVLEEQLLDPSVPPGLPLILGNFLKDLPKTNLSTAKSIILATEDQMLNLELALMAQNSARQVHRNLGLVIRTYDQRFSRELATLLPDASALCAYELAAQAFAGAAFGENMLSLFQLSDRTILVTEYTIEAGDTLVNKLLSQVAYGYRVVPIFHQRREQVLAGDNVGTPLPSDDVRLDVGDRLVVLASINGLQRIERHELLPPQRWRLTADPPRIHGNLIDAGNRLENISGCDLKLARTFMDNLPGTIDLYLYPYQAYRLQEELKKLLPITLVPLRSN
ncbi:MAG: NAD-binding protein [Cyanobacteria bacterium]|nr:NAD-binding protein [Cyanobacteriota bacterium]